jgi:hypothetical protein
MSKQLYNSNGEPIAIPESLEDAKRYRRPHFDGGEQCPICVSRGFTGAISRKRYTANEKCVHCATLDAIELQELSAWRSSVELLPDGRLQYEHDVIGIKRIVTREYVEHMESVDELFNGPKPTTREGAIAMGKSLYIRDVPCSKRGHLGVTTLKGECHYCTVERDKMTPQKLAIKNNEEFYTPNMPCIKCGTVAKRRTKDKKCTGCSPSILGKSSRQKALEAGEIWYDPIKPCITCDTVSPRRVNDGKCNYCLSSVTRADNRISPTSVMMKESPDLILSRVDADNYGIKVYRTGEKCRRGHRGFRYVSTGNCLDCLTSD